MHDDHDDDIKGIWTRRAFLKSGGIALFSLGVGGNPLFINKGSPPTALNARTGLLTPPGIICLALGNKVLEFFLSIYLILGVGLFLPDLA